jgi:periplasmic divalent cation tolerance protein
MRNSPLIVILVTASSNDEAERLAQALVGEGLAACVNILGGVRSIYTWEGKTERADEHLLVIKTRGERFAAVEKRVRELHSYATPEVIALPIVGGSQAYLNWLRVSTGG